MFTNITFTYIRYISFFVIIVLLFLSDLFEDIDLTLSAVGVFIFLFNLFLIYKNNPACIVNSLPYFIALIPMVLGLFYAETGVYLFEIDAYTYANGSVLKVLIFVLIIHEFLLYPAKVVDKSNPIRINKFYVEILMLICIMILYGYFIKTGIPIVEGIHRSEYFSSIVPYYINFIKGRLSFFCLVLGCFYVFYKKKRYILLFFLIVMYYLLCSIKGGELIVVVYMFFLPILLTMKKESFYHVNGKIKKTIILGTFSFLALILFHYSSVENYNKNSDDIEKLYSRMVAAGQVWWAISDENITPSIIRFEEFSYNFDWNDKKNKGMNQLMNEVVPAAFLSEWRSNESRGRSLANGFPAIGYYYFGYAGAFIFTIMIGFLIYISKCLVLSFTLSKDIVAFLFMGAIIELLIRVVAQGDIHILFDARAVVVFFTFSFYLSIKYLLNKSNCR